MFTAEQMLAALAIITRQELALQQSAQTIASLQAELAACRANPSPDGTPTPLRDIRHTMTTGRSPQAPLHAWAAGETYG